MLKRIIVIDDEKDFLETMKRGLVLSGYQKVELENDPFLALQRFENGENFDAALIDITMPGMDGITLLGKIKSASPQTECIMVTALNEASMAMDCIRKGAYDYLVKPISRNDLFVSLSRALERQSLLEILDIRKSQSLSDLDNPDAFSGIVTQSASLIRVLREAELHAKSDVPILITGESGTGKELLARAIHNASPRRGSPFSAINMAAISATLFDAEFFGHTKGAFTGAQASRDGYLCSTDRGSLFLDEIGSLSLELQGKLLRVLQEGEHIPIGKDRPVKTDLRFIAATNEDIEAQIRDHTFRSDLYYRLKGAWLHLPPLRHRKEDIPLLAGYFLKPAKNKGRDLSFHPEAMARLKAYDFPGNIRELKSIVLSAANLCREKEISTKHLPAQFRKNTPRACVPNPGASEPPETLKSVEKKYILSIYELTGKNKSRSAALLDIGLNTLRRKLSAYGVS